MAKRKVIQIVSDGDEGLFVLCDDGTVWMYWWAHNEWNYRQLPTIPEEGEE